MRPAKAALGRAAGATADATFSGGNRGSGLPGIAGSGAVPHQMRVYYAYSIMSGLEKVLI